MTGSRRDTAPTKTRQRGGKAAAKTAAAAARRSEAARRGAETRRRNARAAERVQTARKRSQAAKKGHQTRRENRKRKLVNFRRELLGPVSLTPNEKGSFGLTGADKDDYVVLRAQVRNASTLWQVYLEWGQDEGYSYSEMADEWFSPEI